MTISAQREKKNPLVPRVYYLSHAKKLSDFLSLHVNCCLATSFRFYVQVFSLMLSVVVFGVTPPKSIINSVVFACSNFLGFCRAAKKKKVISFFPISFNTSQVEFFFVDCFSFLLIFWPVICSTLNKRCLEI